MGFSFQKMCKEYAGLAWKFHVSPASCDNPGHYEEFLRLNALSEQEAGRGVTHILTDNGKHEDISNKDSKIVGFITLRATSLAYSVGNNGYVMPALEIAELAVDREYEGHGYGTQLVEIAILIATQLNDEVVGFQNVVLCADPRAVGFYERENVGFAKLEDYYEVLRDGWNDSCIPMYIKLHKKGAGAE